MKHLLVIKEEASVEIHDAFTWYEDRKEGLGYEFIGLLKEYLDRITNNPLLHPIGREKEQVAVMKKFPYKIVYTVENLEVIVFAIFHTSRNLDNLDR